MKYRTAVLFLLTFLLAAACGNRKKTVVDEIISVRVDLVEGLMEDDGTVTAYDRNGNEVSLEVYVENPQDGEGEFKQE